MPATPDFDFALGDNADIIRDSTRRFADERIAPLATKIDADDWFPRDLWPEMGALGLHGITIAEADGGLGLGYLEHVKWSVGRALRWACLTARIQTCASIKSGGGAMLSKRQNISPS